MNKIVGIVFMLFPLLFQVLGVMMLMENARLDKEGVHTTGKLVDYERRVSTSTSKGRTTTSVSYAPVIEFYAGDDKLHRFTSSLSGGKDMEIGTKLEVVYPRSNPERAERSDFWVLYGFPGFMLGFTLIFTVVGFFLLFGDRLFAKKSIVS